MSDDERIHECCHCGVELEWPPLDFESKTDICARCAEKAQAMTDDERIARLTELARRVVLAQEPDVDPETVTVEVWGEGEGRCATACSGRFTIDYHPRALEALEAALCVLAGGILEEHYRQRINIAETRAQTLEAELVAARMPAPWVEKLAEEWERDADACERAHQEWGGASLQVAKALRQTATELRARAKPGT